MSSVLIVSPDPAVPGGVSTFVETMKRHMRDYETQAFYVGSSGRGGEGVLSTLVRLVVAPLRLARLVRRQFFDVVHLNPSFDAKSMLRDGLLLLALRAVGYDRALFFVHGWDKGLEKAVGAWPPLRVLVAWLMNKAACVSVLDLSFREALIEMGVHPERIVVMRTMFDGDGFLAVRDEPRIEGRPFILFMSRFDREKGARELVRAFAALANDYDGYDLVLAGSGEDAEALYDLVDELDLTERVRLTGYVGGDEKWKLLRDCEFFALPTFYRSEGMPVAVLEAMGAGKPLLVGAVGALPRLVNDPENGVVLQAISTTSVENGLLRLLSDAAFRQAASRRNADLAWTKYEANAVTADIEGLYSRIAPC